MICVALIYYCSGLKKYLMVLIYMSNGKYVVPGVGNTPEAVKLAAATAVTAIVVMVVITAEEKDEDNPDPFATIVATAVI